MARRTRAALALGSGGARGYAHIGAIQVLEERGIEIVTIAGASMGAVVGGLYAAGHLDEYTEWVRGLTQLDVFKLLDVSVAKPGMIRAEKVFARLHVMLKGALIEDLPVPFTAVATDLYARKAVWLQHGPVDKAIRASFAMPGVFTPVMLNGRLLVDGGLMDPVPIAPTASVAADVTIAIDLGGERMGPPDVTPAHETAEERPSDEWADRFRRGASHILEADVVRAIMSRIGGAGYVDPTAAAANPLESFPHGLGKFDVMSYSLEAMQTVLTRYRLADNPPDILISIPKDASRSLEYHRASELIALGRALTIEALDTAALTGLPG
jgi:NTE family protein